MEELARSREMCARLEAEVAALRRGEEQYRELLEISPIPIGIHHEGVIAFVNRALVSLLRAGSAEECVGSSMFQFLHPEHREAVAARTREAVRTGSNPPPVVVKFVARDGTLLDVETIAAPVTFSGRQAMLVMVRDITQARRAAEEKEKLAAQMMLAQKLDSLGVLAGGIAHQFNNFLMAVIGNLELAALALPSPSPAREHLQAAGVASQRAVALSQQMLAYSGRGTFFVEPLSLNRIIEEMIPMLEIALPKRARLRLELSPELPEAEADASQLRQVVMNLVVNAAEALDGGGGEVTLATRAERCDRERLARTWIDDGLKEGTYVVLEVADTGSGMDAATAARAFDPFFTTRFEGRGLGLPAVLGIARGHRGALELGSEPGKGTRLRVFLPATGEGAK